MHNALMRRLPTKKGMFDSVHLQLKKEAHVALPLDDDDNDDDLKLYLSLEKQWNWELNHKVSIRDFGVYDVVSLNYKLWKNKISYEH